MLLYHEINNTLYIKKFIVPLNKFIIPSRTKFIRQGLQLPWFFERTTNSGKISLETKLGLQSNSVNVTPSCDLLLIYVASLNNVKP